MTRIHSNNFITSLNGSISDSTTTIILTAVTGFPVIGGGVTCNVTLANGPDIEIVTATARSSFTLTVTRGAEGTVAKAFASGSTASIRPTADSVDRKADLASPTFTGTVVLPSTTSIGTVSSTEIGYVDGVTSAIQTQLDSKITGGTLGTNVNTFLTTPTSANLAAALTDETGTGAAVFANTPTLVTPVLGTPTSGTLTNCTGLPVAGGGTGVASTTAYAVLCGGTTSTGALQSVSGLGTSTYVLTSNGADALPTWQAAAGGSGSPGGSDTQLQYNNSGAFAGVTGATSNGTIVTLTSPTFITPALGTVASGVISACTSTSMTMVTPILGTPTSGTLTNCTLPVGGITGLGTGVATMLATPSSANLASAITDETGSGALVFATSPTLVTPALGTIASGNLSAGTGSLASLTTITTSADITINGLTVGKGLAAVASNTAFGVSCLASITSGVDVVAIGNAAMDVATTYSASIAIGTDALGAATTGANGRSVAIGHQALKTGTTFTGNVAVGWQSLLVATGSSNTSLGSACANNLTTGQQCVIIGKDGSGGTTATGNVVVGVGAFGSGTTGGSNTVLGYFAGSSSTDATGEGAITTGSYCTFLGTASNASAADSIGCLALGASAVAVKATGATSGDAGPGIAIGSVEHPVGFRGDASIYPGNLWRVKVNGTAYMIPLAADASTSLPVANGGTNATSAGITAFNNITGYTAAGATGTTSTNIVFSTSPTLITPVLGAATATSVVITKVNGTEASNAVTASGNAGVITTSALTTAASGNYAITWTNTTITSTSVIMFTIMGGTNTTQATKFTCVPGSGSATLTIYNLDLVNALNGTILIGYQVL